MSKKLMTLSLMVLSGSLFATGCLNSFWQGFAKTGFSFGGHKWVDVTLDIIREDLFS